MNVNKALFYKTIMDVTAEEHARFNIGTYKEKKLHKILKLYLEPNTDFHEVPCSGYIADIMKDGHIIEIETSGFTGLRSKLSAYLPDYKVTLVFPITAVRWLSWIDPESGEISAKRRSPKKENVFDLLFECVYILEYLNHPNLEILGLCLELQEYRTLDGWNRNRKRGSHRFERIPTDLLDSIKLSNKKDYSDWIPTDCTENFTAAQFCKAIGKNQYTGRAIIKVLREIGVLCVSGKSGRTILYSRVNTQDSQST